MCTTHLLVDNHHTLATAISRMCKLQSSYIIVDLLMGFYGFHLHSSLLLQIKAETKKK